MPYLHIQAVKKSFGAHQAIQGIDLDIEQGEFVVFVGPSGCGKSTLLRMIAGLESIDEGRLWLAQRDITHVASSQRDLAMVFQSYALYPHMSVYDNMSFALRLAKVDPSTVRTKVHRAAEILNLGPYLQRTPRELSGGQRQRVAIGRAIVREPKVFLFDEPLSNLDAALRGQTRVELAKLHRELGATTVYVTHDQVEAMTLADRVVVMRNGQIEQQGPPLRLYDKPANRFVAQFIGTPPMNMCSNQAMPPSLRRACPVLDPEAGFGFRPEDAKIVQPLQADFVGQVELVEALGAETLVYVRIADAPSLVVKQSQRGHWQVGEEVGVQLDASRTHWFDSQGKAIRTTTH